MKSLTMLFFTALIGFSSLAQQTNWQGKFEQLGQTLPTPNGFRTGSGAPGAAYWQQRADYTIEAIVDEATNTLQGKETITYHNNSPDALTFLWMQLDQNINKKGNEDFGSAVTNLHDSISTLAMQYLVRPVEFPAGYTIKAVTDNAGRALPVTINNTMMRVDLPEPLKAGGKFIFSVSWTYPITDRSMFALSREGYEYYPADNNKVYLIAHWFPRMAVYNDAQGWQNKQFQRLGEFALEFGDYKVSITVPADHVVAATGSLQNAKEVLAPKELQRLEAARNSFDKPAFIITPDEARAKEKVKSAAKKTWQFSAENVRDFAFASSRKFIWDAQAVKLPTNTTMAMSFYPKEGLPVWQEESTKAVKNALEIYSKYTFDYPYPVAISVNTSNIGMEFPMISFNGGRPNKEGKMSDGSKAGMITTIVHEVGHNWFPMIVSSDERQWMWMDEGLNTFLHTRTMAERYPQYPHTTPKSIVPFMRGDQSIMRPVMTTSDNELFSQFGANYYEKPTVALTILRETIMGKELFDVAFKEYANRWKYKHPNPADLFRTLEDVSAVDLDWFWRGWFLTTDRVDVAVDEVKWFKIRAEATDIEGKGKKVQQGDLNAAGGKGKNADFNDGPQELTLTATDGQWYGEFLSRIDETGVRRGLEGKNLYEVKLKNAGGLVTPVVIEWNYKDGSKEIEQLPAEIWRLNEQEITKVFVKDKEVASMVIDPDRATADVDVDNNVFPKREIDSKFDQFKKKQN